MSNRILGFIPVKWYTMTVYLITHNTSAVFDHLWEAQRFLDIDPNPVVETEDIFFKE